MGGGEAGSVWGGGGVATRCAGFAMCYVFVCAFEEQLGVRLEIARFSGSLTPFLKHGLRSAPAH